MSAIIMMFIGVLFIFISIITNSIIDVYSTLEHHDAPLTLSIINYLSFYIGGILLFVSTITELSS